MDRVRASGFEKPCSRQLHWLLMSVWLAELTGTPPSHTPTPCSEPAEAMEIRVAIQASDVRAEGERVTAAFKQWVDAGQRMRSCDKLGVKFGFAGGAGQRLGCTCTSGRSLCRVLQGCLWAASAAEGGLKVPPLRPNMHVLAAGWLGLYTAGCGGASHWKLEAENYEGWRVKVSSGSQSWGWW